MPIVFDTDSEGRLNYCTVGDEFLFQQTDNTGDMSPVVDTFPTMWGEIPEQDIPRLIELARQVYSVEITSSGEKRNLCTAFPAGMNVMVSGLPYDVFFTSGHCIESSILDQTAGQRISFNGQPLKTGTYAVRAGGDRDLELILQQGNTFGSSPFIIEPDNTTFLRQLADKNTPLYQLGYPSITADTNAPRIQRVAIHINSFNEGDRILFFHPSAVSMQAGLTKANEGGSSGGPIGFLGQDGRFHVIAVTRGFNSNNLIIGDQPIVAENVIAAFNNGNPISLNRQAVTYNPEPFNEGYLAYDGKYDITKIGVELSKIIPPEPVTKLVEILALRNSLRVSPSSSEAQPISITVYSGFHIGIEHNGQQFDVYFNYDPESSQLMVKTVSKS